MKSWIIIWSVILTLSYSFGQETSYKPGQASYPDFTTRYFEPYLSVNNSENDLAIHSDFESHLTKLEKVRTRRKSDYSFLKAIFYKTHTSLLGEYERLATMDQTLRTKQFGCLTGTAIYAMILDYFNYDYNIIELPNHVFIHLKIDEDSYVFESTLPYNGFRKTTAELDRLLKQPWVNHRRISELNTVGDWFEDFKKLPGHYNTINLTQLAGLQYFNESAKYYQEKEYLKAMDLISKGYELYPSTRNEKLMQLIINKILKYDEIKEEVKNQYLEKYVRFVKHQRISQTK